MLKSGNIAPPFETLDRDGAQLHALTTLLWEIFPGTNRMSSRAGLEASKTSLALPGNQTPGSPARDPSLRQQNRVPLLANG
jgi:hypothetical protein